MLSMRSVAFCGRTPLEKKLLQVVTCSGCYNQGSLRVCMCVPHQSETTSALLLLLQLLLLLVIAVVVSVAAVVIVVAVVVALVAM